MSDQNFFEQAEDGQAIREEDLDSMAANGGAAVDRAIWELLRLRPGNGTVQKGIIPYGVSGWAAYTGLTSTAQVQGNTADAKVRVMPFRAIIGSTSALASPYTDTLREQRSAYAIASTFYTEITIAANASGNPRWDLIYATVTPDADSVTELRSVKDPSPPHAVAAQNLVTYKRTSVVISRLGGTAAATPVFPTTPGDGSGSYVIRLAYVYVPNGFGAASTVLREYIRDIAPVLPIHSSMGVPNIQPANQSFYADGATNGTVFTNQGRHVATKAPGAYLPSTMVGGESRIILLQLSLAPASHVHGDVVDNSIDWRFRFFRWFLYVKDGNTAADGFASDRAATAGALVPSAAIAAAAGQKDWGFGQSYADDGAAWGGTGAAALHVLGADLSNLGAAPNSVSLYVNMTTGALHVSLVSAPTGQIYIELNASAPYSNFGTV